MQRLILIFAIMLALPQPADAQQVAALRKGLRIEVTPLSGKIQTGRIMSVRNDSLFYAASGVSSRAIRESDASSVAFADVKSVRVIGGVIYGAAQGGERWENVALPGR